jgi:hypothetical protein
VAYDDIIRLAIAEGELEYFAGLALEADDPAHMHHITDVLLDAAEANIDIVSDFEETRNPRKVAREVIIWAATDTRKARAIRPDDHESRRIKEHQKHLASVLEYLDSLNVTNGE